MNFRDRIRIFQFAIIQSSKAIFGRKGTTTYFVIRFTIIFGVITLTEMPLGFLRIILKMTYENNKNTLADESKSVYLRDLSGYVINSALLNQIFIFQRWETQTLCKEFCSFYQKI